MQYTGSPTSLHRGQNQRTERYFYQLAMQRSNLFSNQVHIETEIDCLCTDVNPHKDYFDQYRIKHKGVR